MSGSSKESGKFSPEIFKEFIEVQKKQALNDAEKNKIKFRELELNAEYSKDIVSKQHDLLKNKPKQDRYTIITYSSIAIAFMVLFCVFMGFLLHKGKDDLVDNILTWLGRIVILVVTFVLGRMSKPGNNKFNDQSTSDAVEVAD